MRWHALYVCTGLALRTTLHILLGSLICIIIGKLFTNVEYKVVCVYVYMSDSKHINFAQKVQGFLTCSG